MILDYLPTHFLLQPQLLWIWKCIHNSSDNSCSEVIRCLVLRRFNQVICNTNSCETDQPEQAKQNMFDFINTIVLEYHEGCASVRHYSGVPLPHDSIIAVFERVGVSYRLQDITDPVVMERKECSLEELQLLHAFAMRNSFLPLVTEPISSIQLANVLENYYGASIEFDWLYCSNDTFSKGSILFELHKMGLLELPRDGNPVRIRGQIYLRNDKVFVEIYSGSYFLPNQTREIEIPNEIVFNRFYNFVSNQTEGKIHEIILQNYWFPSLIQDSFITNKMVNNSTLDQVLQMCGHVGEINSPVASVIKSRIPSISLFDTRSTISKAKMICSPKKNEVSVEIYPLLSCKKFYQGLSFFLWWAGLLGILVVYSTGDLQGSSLRNTSLELHQ